FCVIIEIVAISKAVRRDSGNQAFNFSFQIYRTSRRELYDCARHRLSYVAMAHHGRTREEASETQADVRVRQVIEWSLLEQVAESKKIASSPSFGPKRS